MASPRRDWKRAEERNVKLEGSMLGLGNNERGKVNQSKVRKDGKRKYKETRRKRKINTRDEA